MSTTVADSPSQPVQTQVKTNPYVGILAVFMGAGLATLNSRLLSVGLPDLRGALGFSFDAASWIPTALNMATMFSGVFVVFLNAFWGPRQDSATGCRDLYGQPRYCCLLRRITR